MNILSGSMQVLHQSNDKWAILVIIVDLEFTGEHTCIQDSKHSIYEKGLKLKLARVNVFACAFAVFHLYAFRLKSLFVGLDQVSHPGREYLRPPAEGPGGQAARTVRATAATVGSGAVRRAWGGARTVRVTAAAVGPRGEGQAADKFGWGHTNTKQSHSILDKNLLHIQSK